MKKLPYLSMPYLSPEAKAEIESLLENPTEEFLKFVKQLSEELETLNEKQDEKKP